MINKKVILYLGIIFAFIVAIHSCEYATIPPPPTEVVPEDTTDNDTIPSDTIVVTEIKFSTDIAPALDANCKVCHSGTRKPDFRAANSYSSLKTNGYITAPGATSVLYLKIKSGHNSSKITTTVREKLIKWIDDGAKNN